MKRFAKTTNKTNIKKSKKAFIESNDNEIESEDDISLNNGTRTFDSIIPKIDGYSANVKTTFKVDSLCSLTNAQVVDDYDCMLNQTNINANNNKFYVIQLLESGGTFYTWNRWGRVGENGQNVLSKCPNKEKAIVEFSKKFRDKTGNIWNNRTQFQPIPGKYTLLEMGEETSDDISSQQLEVVSKNFRPSTLHIKTQRLVDLIFSTDMFNDALSELKIDTKKMPLGKLSRQQISKGFDCLDAIQAELNANCRHRLGELSSQFYTLIPHSFGRSVPPLIDCSEAVRAKLDMLLVLLDIETAQRMQSDSSGQVGGGGGSDSASQLTENPCDRNYRQLHARLELLNDGCQESRFIGKYVQQTCSHYQFTIQSIWTVDREGEAERFLSHDSVENRKLLWHGTNIAVVAAILKTGLRIMPHSGGRVGKGIYFASEHSKSASYVSASKSREGVMFLCEVVLDDEFTIQTDDSSLVKPPPGFGSVVARGRTEPDPKFDESLLLDGHKVVVPQGKPVPTSYRKSAFTQSEYLIYNESQCRIRYLVLFTV